MAETTASSLESESLPKPLSAKYTESFAYKTVKDRLPVILTKIIDLLYRDRKEIAVLYGEAAVEDTKAATGQLSKLRNEMMTNKEVILLDSDATDTKIWNSYLAQYMESESTAPYWFEAPWLYVECYMYRRIWEAFQLSSSIKDFDPFRKQKEEAYSSSIEAMAALARFLQDVQVESASAGHLVENFFKFLELSLWSNKFDLSMSVGVVRGPSSNPLDQLDLLRDNIIVNESEALWNMLQNANQKHGSQVCIAFILDNAGFELFADFCLAEFLQCAGLVSTVHFYVKAMPWFVSDTTATDFTWSLQMLCKSSHSVLSNLGQRWTNRVINKSWVIQEAAFWTLPYDYSSMLSTDAELYKKLCALHLIIFKGDLNYRKLVGDRQWKFTTPFSTALRGFLPTPLCTVRTLKADVVVGLQAGKAEQLQELHSDWLISGDFAVIQCASPLSLQ